MIAKKVRECLLSKPESEEDYPYGPDVMVYKVKGKMFALLSEQGRKKSNSRAQMNLKCAPLEAIQLRDVFNDVIAGYHMNKKHWNTLYLTDDKSISDIPQGEIQHQVDNSYALVLKGITKAQKHSLETTYSCEQLYGF